MAISLLLAAGCNRPEAEDPVTPEKPKGKYELKELTATLPEADTKTSLDGTTKVVKWQDKDRIAIIDKDGDVHQYMLEGGAGTPIGRFVNVSTTADYDNLSQLTAIFPAIAVDAAFTNTTSASIRINTDHSGDYANYGISSWNYGITDTDFRYNDIKVAKPSISTTGNESVGLNFKFTQLGTWCTFTFDFTQSPDFDTVYSLGESITGMTVSTNEGGTPVAISGNATLNLSSLAISGISETSVSKTLSSSELMTSARSYEVMLYPTISTNDELVITLKTNTHTFKFYGTPTHALQGGTTLKFPITVDKNFTKTGTTLRYTRENKSRAKFYYYGTQNCFLLPPTLSEDQNKSIITSPHTTDIYYHHNDTDSGSGAPVANGAELLWQDVSGLITSVNYNSGTKTINYTRAAGKYGNAVIALKSGSDILWSYHIWCPEDTPTELTYIANLNGEQKTVMTMPLGATKDYHAATSIDDIEGYGLLYQWGRKDPLGRPAVVYSTSSNDTERTYYDLSGEIDCPFVKSTRVNVGDIIAGWTGSIATEGSDDYQTRSQFMQNIARANPTTFFYASADYANDWASQNDNTFWGNYMARGSYPRMAKTYKSIFDPCPQGYRVPPEDTWVGATTTRRNYSNEEDRKYWNVYGNSGYDSTNLWFETVGVIGLATAHGYAIYYDGIGPDDGHHTDFYPASGYRNNGAGDLGGVGGNGSSWSSAPAAYFNITARIMSPLASGNRAYGLPVRCVKEP